MVFIFLESLAFAGGNTVNDSFSKAKKMLLHQVYFDHRITIYCGAQFDENKNIILPEGFITPAHEKRANRIEWEHAVPAENFGQIFVEWREGNAQCVDNRGNSFKGRKCAEKTNKTYRYMQADMYNLFPSIGAVNAVRSNKSYAALGGNPSFGSCEAKVDTNKFEPPNKSKGALARAAKYMAAAYPEYRLSRQQQRLFDGWDEKYPVDAWECTRARRIEMLQGNENGFVKRPCRQAGLW